MQAIRGLTEREARARQERGEGNDVELATSRSYWEIARANIFNLFNGVLVTIATLLIALGRVSDALISIGPLFVANAVIRTAQEVYAKWQLDQIALAGRSLMAVIRDGKEKTIDACGIVKGDILHVRAGDQIVADGILVGEGALDLDKSLLSGKSDPVVKRVGDPLLSGSFCVAGDAFYEVGKVGTKSFANQLTASARRFAVVKTPLQLQVDFAVRFLIFVVAIMSILILVAGVLGNLPLIRLVQISAVLTGEVPYGLFFMVVVAYGLSAVLIGRRGAVVPGQRHRIAEQRRCAMHGQDRHVNKQWPELSWFAPPEWTFRGRDRGFAWQLHPQRFTIQPHQRRHRRWCAGRENRSGR